MKNFTFIRKIVLKAFIFIALLSQFTFYSIYAQGGAAINITGAIADPSAILDISSADKGLLIPRVSLKETILPDPITTPTTSLIIYNTAAINDVTPGFYYWDNSEWKPLGSSVSGGASPWASTNSSIHQVDISENVGIGTTTPDPSASLDIQSTNTGILIPRLTTLQRDAIPSPAVGLQIFNLDCMGIDTWNGSCWISMLPPLPHPGIINASSTVFCPATIHNFSISPIVGATNYAWTVPPGATVINGQGTTNIEVEFGDYSGRVCVVAYDNCSSSPQSCIDVQIINLPDAPRPINGLTTIAKGGEPINYYITPVTGATTYTWTTPLGTTITSGTGTPNIKVDFPCSASSGDIIVSYQNACGVTKQSELYVTAGPIADAGSDVFAINTIGGSPTAKAGTPPYVYTWNPYNGLSSYTVANPTANCAGSTTTYTLTVTDNNGCQATSSVVVTRNNNVIADAGNDITFSNFGETATLGGVPTASNGAGPYTYTWSPSLGLSNASVANPSVCFDAAPGCIYGTTTYTVTVTDICGTTATSSVVVNTPFNNIVADAGTDITLNTPSETAVIGGAPTASEGATPYTYSWSPAAGLSSTTVANPTVHLEGTSCIYYNTTYTVTVTDVCGTTATSSVVVNVVNNIKADAGTNITLNTPSETAVIGGAPTASDGAVPYTYSWSPAAGLSSTTVANPSVSCVYNNITYTVTVTDICGNTATSSVLVSSGDLPNADAGTDITLNYGNSDTIGGAPTASEGAAPYTYSWSPSIGLSNTTVANPTVCFDGTSQCLLNTTTYTVNVTDVCGTTATSSVIVDIKGQAFLYTGVANEQWVVPSGVTQINIEAWGAQGDGPKGGLGAYATTTLNVTPGETLYINVGGQGGQPTGGFNGGGQGGSGTNITAYGGGGASDVRQGGTALNNRVLVGAGGGGTCSRFYNNNSYTTNGGAGGYQNGIDGAAYSSTVDYKGKGGTQSAGGSSGTVGNTGTSGSSGIGGNGAYYSNNSTIHSSGGGGGGGYYGGGGGCAYYSSTVAHGGGGGGGSSYYGGVSGSAEATGTNTGNGKVIITY